MSAPKAQSELIEHVRSALAAAGPFDRESCHSVATDAGSYVLLVHLPRSLAFERPSLRHQFGAGWYGYAGSARGPGGLRARIARHLRKEKALHWHVDSLTIAADSILAFAVEGASECALAGSLLRSGFCRPSADGFGSSDCRSCSTHLLELQERSLDGVGLWSSAGL